MRLGGRAGTAKRHCSTRVGGDSHCSTRVYQYRVLGLAYGPQECADANWRRPTLQTRPGIPGAGMPIPVLRTGIPAYCGGCRLRAIRLRFYSRVESHALVGTRVDSIDAALDAIGFPLRAHAAGTGPSELPPPPPRAHVRADWTAVRR